MKSVPFGCVTRRQDNSLSGTYGGTAVRVQEEKRASLPKYQSRVANLGVVTSMGGMGRTGMGNMGVNSMPNPGMNMNHPMQGRCVCVHGGV